MNSNQKNILQTTSRWVRVGVLSASALAPVVGSVVERIRAQQQAEQAVADIRNADRKEKVTAFANDVQSDLQDRLQSIGGSLSDVLAELRDHSTNPDLLKRGNELTEELKKRSSKFSQVVAERSGEVSNEFARRSGEVSNELAKRSRRAQKNIAKSSRQAQKNIAKRSRLAQKNIAEQDRSLWIALGFGVGLTAASIVTFFLIRRRLQHVDIVEEEVIQLPDDALRTAATSTQRPGAIYSMSAGGKVQESQPFDGVVAVKNNDNGQSPQSANELVENEQVTPTDASFVGLASTKQYYPVETPLDQLSEVDGKPVDVIYFSSEQEAQEQGFSAAAR
ncbi:hypothetical protein KDA_21550 [Dictyobacter alpinus]|uniref:Uncharacterized protein n=1 Tax=Dictyobacter alpinus TaxID=2014873 RepID=A0A402B5N5_9CHLR|nr:hypothetical protein [Dictyobacter alpinus]GCE26671.1 hypothetical protein KDA_21550 [Dictyobacter alpinus]